MTSSGRASVNRESPSRSESVGGQVPLVDRGPPRMEPRLVLLSPSRERRGCFRTSLGRLPRLASAPRAAASGAFVGPRPRMRHRGARRTLARGGVPSDRCGHLRRADPTRAPPRARGEIPPCRPLGGGLPCGQLRGGHCPLLADPCAAGVAPLAVPKGRSLAGPRGVVAHNSRSHRLRGASDRLARVRSPDAVEPPRSRHLPAHVPGGGLPHRAGGVHPRG